MLKELHVFIITLGSLGLVVALIITLKLYYKEKRKVTLCLIPVLFIFLFGYVSLIANIYQDPVINNITTIVSIVFFAGGIFCAGVLKLISQSISRIAFAEVNGLFNQNYHHISGLLNRKSLLSELDKKIAQPDSQFSIITLYISNFNSIEEVIGHKNAESLLKAYALKLNKLVNRIKKEQPVLAFHSQNHGFCLLLDENNQSKIKLFLQKVNLVLDEAIVVNGLSLTLKNNIGVSCYPLQNTLSTLDGKIETIGSKAATQTVDCILQSSETAAIQAQKMNKLVSFYCPNLSSSFKNKAELLAKLHQAIEQKDFSLHYQEVFCTNQSNALCFEALIRWSLNGEFVSPAEFIPLAEQSNYIKKISHWVLATAVEQLDRWNQDNIYVTLQVNLSSKDLEDDKIVIYLSQLLAKSSINPSQLMLEITETSIMQNVEHSREILNKIKALGINLSIDDYGTGFSSLSILSEMPIDELKIDRSFVTHLMQKKVHEAIVISTIELAHRLNCQVVAEGIETAEVATFLMQHGCDKLQGFYINKPMPLEQINQRFKAENRLQKRQFASTG